MRLLVIFGTTEGHTRELCQFAAERLRGMGHTVAVEEATASAGAANVLAYDAVIIAGSLHLGRFQRALLEFVASHREALAAKPSAFITVSLSAAGDDPHDWEGLRECIVRFEHETNWTPTAIHNAAGAIRYSRYKCLKSLAIKYIAARRGQKTVMSRDCDLTDYAALTRFLREFVERVSQRKAGLRRCLAGLGGSGRATVKASLQRSCSLGPASDERLARRPGRRDGSQPGAARQAGPEGGVA